MHSEDKWALGAIVAGLLAVALFFVAMLTTTNVDEWTKIDDSGKCWVHHIVDNRFFRGNVAESRETFCKAR